MGVEIYPGFSASEVLYGDDGEVCGVATGDMGVAKDGTPTENHQPGIELHATQTLFAEGCRGSLTKTLFERFKLRRGKDPQTYAIGIKELWKNDRLKNKFTSSVLHEYHLYGLDDQDDKRTALVCLKAATGKEIWRGDDFGHGQLLLADGHLIILSESGEIALVKASPKSFQQIARIPALTGKTWNNPAIAGGHLYIRNSSEMVCYDISEGSTGGSTTVLFNTSQTMQVIAAGLGLMLLLGGGVLFAIAKIRGASSPTAPEDS